MVHQIIFFKLGFCETIRTMLLKGLTNVQTVTSSPAKMHIYQSGQHSPATIMPQIQICIEIVIPSLLCLSEHMVCI